MEGWKRKVLTKNHVAIIDVLDPKDVIDHLIQEDIFTDRQAERILALTPRDDRAREFMFQLKKKGPVAYDEFMQSIETPYPDLYLKLKNGDEMDGAVYQEMTDLNMYGGHNYELENDPAQTELKRVVEAPVTAPEPVFDLVQHLGMEQRRQVITPKMTVVISNNLGDAWLPLAQILGFKSAEIDRFRGMNQYKIDIQALEMLNAWRRREHKKATVENIIQAMQSAGIQLNHFKEIFLNN